MHGKGSKKPKTLRKLHQSANTSNRSPNQLKKSLSQSQNSFSTAVNTNFSTNNDSLQFSNSKTIAMVSTTNLPSPSRSSIISSRLQKLAKTTPSVLSTQPINYTTFDSKLSKVKFLTVDHKRAYSSFLGEKMNQSTASLSSYLTPIQDDSISTPTQDDSIPTSKTSKRKLKLTPLSKHRIQLIRQSQRFLSTWSRSGSFDKFSRGEAGTTDGSENDEITFSSKLIKNTPNSTASFNQSDPQLKPTHIGGGWEFLKKMIGNDDPSQKLPPNGKKPSKNDHDSQMNDSKLLTWMTPLSDIIPDGLDPIAQKRIEKWREFGEKYREKEILTSIERRKTMNEFKEVSRRIFSAFTPATDAEKHGNYPDHIGTRHEYSDLQPLFFSSNEFPSFFKEDMNKFLSFTGLKRYTDMVMETADDFVDHLNKSEPFGQRPSKRKYRLRSKLNKPFARYSIDEEEDQQKKEQSRFHELEVDYYMQRDENERLSIDLKRKARQSMGLEPDISLEQRWSKLTAESPAVIQDRKTTFKPKNVSEFEKFRDAFKKKDDIYGDAKDDDDDKLTAEEILTKKNAELDKIEPVLAKLRDVMKYREELYDMGRPLTRYDVMKPRKLIYDNFGIQVPRDDLFGYPAEYMRGMPQDEEDMSAIEQLHWRRKLKEANKRKYFKGGWRYEPRWGMGPKHQERLIWDKGDPLEPRYTRPILTHFGFGGGGAPGRGQHRYTYDYIYGRKIPQLQSHGGILTVDLFREFPWIFRENKETPEWTGTTALTYDPQQNQVTRFELRMTTLKYKISMSPLGDLGRWAFNTYNMDVFPLTHFRFPFAWMMTHIRWAWGLKRALSRWTKTATNPRIDNRFAYQSNRFGEHQNEDIYHFINEYDYLKEYQLPIVVRAIREYDFDTLRSACSKHALFNILKWLHIQDRFGVYFEYRRNYWVESLDIVDVRKDQYGSLVLNVEFALVEPPYYYNRAGGKIFNEKAQYKGNYRPVPLIMHMTLQRDKEHPDFDYQVIDFMADARRIKRVFNNIERIYHSAQRSRTQYFRAPKFYAVRRTSVNATYYSRRSKVVGAYHQNLEVNTFVEKELDFQEDMEDQHTEMIKYRETMLMSGYLIALDLEPIMDYIVAKQKEHPAFDLHPIKKDANQYWEQRKELDLVKFRQREARRVRSQQNTLHRYFHKLRALAYFKHTYDHGGDLEEFRRLHIDKLAVDANHDDWVQKWIVDPERRGRPYFKNIKKFAKKVKGRTRKKNKFKFKSKPYYVNTFRSLYWRQRNRKRVARRKMRFRHNGRYRRLARRRYLGRAKHFGHAMHRQSYRKRRRFMPYMERMFVQLGRGAFWENKKFFRVRNHRVNRFKGNTTAFSPKQKGPGYSQYDTAWHEQWHVWDGGYYNPNEYCWTRADVFNPENDPFDPRRNYAMSFLDDNTLRIPFSPYRDWDLPYRLLPYRNPYRRRPSAMPHLKPRFKNSKAQMRGNVPAHLAITSAKRYGHLRFGDLPNAELFDENDDIQHADHEERRQWPTPDDGKWKI